MKIRTGSTTAAPRFVMKSVTLVISGTSSL
jgi:hypothetical protein